MKRLQRHIFRMAWLAVFALGCISSATAQNDAQLTQYWHMPTLYNPAAAGGTEYLRIRGGVKMQWVGITNAPISYLAALDMPLKVGKKLTMGVGANLTSEDIGLFANLGINLQVAARYKIFGGELSAAVQGGYYSSRFRSYKIEIPKDDDYHQSKDEAIPTSNLEGKAFDLSAGVMFTHKYFYAGLSCLHILEPEITMGIIGSESTGAEEYYMKVGRMMYFTAGSNIEIKNTLFEIQPSMQLRTDFRLFSGEITARASYNKFLTFGLGYRLNEALSVMAGVEIKNFYLGYAYDYPLSALGRATWGSHEIMAGYRLKLNFGAKNRNKHKSIRIM